MKNSNGIPKMASEQSEHSELCFHNFYVRYVHPNYYRPIKMHRHHRFVTFYSIPPHPRLWWFDFLRLRSGQVAHHPEPIEGRDFQPTLLRISLRSTLGFRFAQSPQRGEVCPEGWQERAGFISEIASSLRSSQRQLI